MRRATLLCIAAATLAGAALLPAAARAGNSCDDKPLQVEAVV
jgi:hypothetical protein